MQGGYALRRLPPQHVQPGVVCRFSRTHARARSDAAHRQLEGAWEGCASAQPQSPSPVRMSSGVHFQISRAPIFQEGARRVVCPHGLRCAWHLELQSPHWLCREQRGAWRERGAPQTAVLGRPVDSQKSGKWAQVSGGFGSGIRVRHTAAPSPLPLPRGGWAGVRAVVFPTGPWFWRFCSLSSFHPSSGFIVGFVSLCPCARAPPLPRKVSRRTAVRGPLHWLRARLCPAGLDSFGSLFG